MSGPLPGTAILEPDPRDGRWFRLAAWPDPGFVVALKGTVEAAGRRWRRDEEVWVIRRPYHAAVVRLCRWYFTDVRDTVPPEPADGPPPAGRKRRRPATVTGTVAVPEAPSVPAHWRALHLLPTAPREIVRGVYKALSLLHHPDRGGDTARMQDINIAYQRICQEKGWT